MYVVINEQSFDNNYSGKNKIGADKGANNAYQFVCFITTCMKLIILLEIITIAETTKQLNMLIFLPFLIHPYSSRLAQ